MKGKLLRNVSVVTIVLAVALALYAVRLGRQLGHPDESAEAPQATLTRIVVAAETIEPGREITQEVLRLEATSFEPEGAFHRIEEIAGRTTAVQLVPGEPLMEKHFRANSAITRRLEPGERAMAVKVDGVIGMGGFIQPGDRVDVIVFVARDQKEVEATHARLLLEDIRGLAYGEKLETDDAEEGKPSDARTAVLAVPHADASRLMLGASKGRLRLALRSPSEVADTHGGGDGALSLETLAGEHGKGAAAAPAPLRKASGTPRRVVYRTDPKEITRY